MGWSYEYVHKWNVLSLQIRLDIIRFRSCRKTDTNQSCTHWSAPAEHKRRGSSSGSDECPVKNPSETAVQRQLRVTAVQFSRDRSQPPHPRIYAKICQLHPTQPQLLSPLHEYLWNLPWKYPLEFVKGAVELPTYIFISLILTALNCF